MTTAGQLSERFAFDSRTAVDDGFGNTEGVFAEQFVVWSRRQYLRGTEAFQNARLQGRQPVLLTIRASSQSKRITTDWQARDTRAGTVYAIKAVNPTEDRAWIEILASAGEAS